MKYLLAIFIPLLSGFFTSGPLVTYKTDQAQSTLVISGTSNLHDWQIKAVSMSGTINADLYTDSISVKNLKLSIPVKSLKSGNSGMDKNTYKTLKAEDFSHIHYQLVKIKSLKRTSPTTFELISEGKITVAGNSQVLEIPLEATVKKEGIVLRGETSFLMSRFDIEPPSFMFGSLTTGDKVNIRFNINYN